VYLCSGAGSVRAGCSRCGALYVAVGDGSDVELESLEPLRQSDGVLGDEDRLEECSKVGCLGLGGISLLRRLMFSPLEFKASMAKVWYGFLGVLKKSVQLVAKQKPCEGYKLICMDGLPGEKMGYDLYISGWVEK
jgi:hypothetical protein